METGAKFEVVMTNSNNGLEWFRVHAKGCSDIAKEVGSTGGHSWDMDQRTATEVVKQLKRDQASDNNPFPANEYKILPCAKAVSRAVKGSRIEVEDPKHQRTPLDAFRSCTPNGRVTVNGLISYLRSEYVDAKAKTELGDFIVRACEAYDPLTAMVRKLQKAVEKGYLPERIKVELWREADSTLKLSGKA